MPRVRTAHQPWGRFALCGWTVFVLLFLYLPVALLIAYSFNTSRLNIRWEGFTLDWYKLVWADRVLIESVVNSLVVAGVTTALSVALGAAGAWLLYRYRLPLRRTLQTLMITPMVMPEVIIGVSLLVFFAVVNTWGNRVLAQMGIMGNPMGLGMVTVIIAHVTFCFPFVAVIILARLVGMDPALEEAAQDLGATPTVAFFRVIVPYLMPALVAGGLLALALSLDELIVTYFVFDASSQTLPITIFGRVKRGLDPRINAISTVFVIVTGLLVVLADWARRRWPAS